MRISTSERSSGVGCQALGAGSSLPCLRNSRKLKGRITVAMLRPRSEVWISRESMRAEEPDTTNSQRSVSITRRTKRSHPSMSWISSRNQ